MAAALAPNNYDIRMDYADLLALGGRYYDALHYYKKSMKELTESGERMANYGATLLCANKAHQALKVLGSSRKKFPDVSCVSISLAASLFVTGRLKVSVKMIGSTLSQTLNPGQELELELMSMVVGAVSVASARSRLQELCDAGARFDPAVILCMLNSANCSLSEADGAEVATLADKAKWV